MCRCAIEAVWLVIFAANGCSDKSVSHHVLPRAFIDARRPFARYMRAVGYTTQQARKTNSVAIEATMLRPTDSARRHCQIQLRIPGHFSISDVKHLIYF